MTRVAARSAGAHARPVVPMSEDELLTAITDWLTVRGWLWTHPRRSDRALTMGHPGVPDVIAARAGRVVFIELKSERGSPTYEQAAWLRALRGDPAAESLAPEVRLLRPSDLDAAIEELR